VHPLLAVVETGGALAVFIWVVLVAIEAPAHDIAPLNLQVGWLKSVAKNSNVVRIQI
jgi:hypothetical protein